MKRFSLFFLLLIIFSCTKDEEIKKEPKAIEITTGLELVDLMGNVTGKIANPNIYTKRSAVAMYPIPTNSFLSVKSTSSIKNVWIVKAIVSKEFLNVDYSSILNTKLYSSSELKQKSIKSFEGLNKSSLKIDFSSYPEGHYRVFVELANGDIYWSNTYTGIIKGSVFDIDFWK
ncbi:hypothetical protein DS884_11390 [Tenacibaculum sp. E3R01]|uniref:hypothetical protein n=1 Tax=Tenacibaculum sp. E3R01 TaxID=2267227 RepID=UPI000DE96198|nr:hypothetical protein [Tenacibaculum sp. E3R01]RBW57178.1 hypothetical protein DS884_11390 [Tenacibaculum sp. E3R01]